MTCQKFNYKKTRAVKWNLMVAPATLKASCGKRKV
jgi:hypothetical protein